MKNYFPPHETICNCSCGINNVSLLLLEIANSVRAEFGNPIYLNSACRCPKYNENVGGSPVSEHIATDSQPCSAFDIRCENSVDRLKLIQLFLKYGIKRIGIDKAFLHIGVDLEKPQCIWVY